VKSPIKSRGFIHYVNAKLLFILQTTSKKHIMEKCNTEKTPEEALKMLTDGNERFVNNVSINRDLKKEAQDTAGGQTPFAAILSCLDSRVSAELVFDQGIGNVFNFRAAGNFVDAAIGENNNILGSLEFAVHNRVSIILVLGHTGCGAIDAATKATDSIPCNVDDDPMTCMVKRLKSNLTTTDKLEATRENVWKTIDNIRNHSDFLRNSEIDRCIEIRGGIYNLESRSVEFFKYKPPVNATT